MSTDVSVTSSATNGASSGPGLSVGGRVYSAANVPAIALFASSCIARKMRPATLPSFRAPSSSVSA